MALEKAAAESGSGTRVLLLQNLFAARFVSGTKLNQITEKLFNNSEIDWLQAKHLKQVDCQILVGHSVEGVHDENYKSIQSVSHIPNREQNISSCIMRPTSSNPQLYDKPTAHFRIFSQWRQRMLLLNKYSNQEHHHSSRPIILNISEIESKAMNPQGSTSVFASLSFTCVWL